MEAGIEKLGASQWSELGTKLMRCIVREFNTDKHWEYLPSAMVLLGSVILVRSGVQKEDVYSMVDTYLREVHEAAHKEAN